MNLLSDCKKLDNPNIPVLAPATAYTTPYGKFLPYANTESSIADNSFIASKIGDMYLPNFSLRYVEGKFTEDTVLLNQNAQGTELLGSCLFLKGSVRSVLNGQLHGPESDNWSQNFKFDPHNEFIHFCRAGTELDFVHVSYTAEHFNQFLPDDQRWSEDLKNRISKKERIIGERFPAITLLQQQALKNIFECPLDGKLGYMMIETSLVQILLIQLYTLFHRCDDSRPGVASRRDMEVVSQLREHLTKTFLDDHCLSDLARNFGVNTNKLMSLFKKTFGKSIFEFISELRMEHAMTLLRDSGLLVTEVARTLGYKNPNHFSSAFKKKFGVNPSDIK
jgi:AraC-like DNA-binding protein